jgi:hypothetical protein
MVIRVRGRDVLYNMACLNFDADDHCSSLCEGGNYADFYGRKQT